MTDRPLAAHIVASIHEVEAAAWDECAGFENPFLRHAFLAALEDSGSATAETGWLAQHVVLKDEADAVLGCMPMYLKNHSQGEYVFDHGWADAFERAGGRYYPKLQASVPFTPATGPRLLVPPGPQRTELQRALLSACVQRCEQINASSVHVTFLPRDECELAGEAGFLQRTGVQFHWMNDGYADFDAFLATLTSRKRKQLRKERAGAMASGCEIETLSGAAIEEAHWDAFFEFYQDTGSRKWGMPYLTREFFTLLSSTMAEDVVLIMVRRAGRYIAGALNFKGSDTLFGRNWGAIEHHNFLHFEACYYRAIDYAIEHGLARVEAGAQGPHKLARGYIPVPTYSAHWIQNEQFREAVEHYLTAESEHVIDEIEVLGQHAPFRQEDNTE